MHHLPNIKKRGDPAGSPPVAGLTGFCNAITVFILLNFILLIKQFLQFSIVYADVIYHMP